MNSYQSHYSPHLKKAAFNISDSVVKSSHTIQFPVCLKIIVTMNEDNVMAMHEEFGTTTG